MLRGYASRQEARVVSSRAATRSISELSRRSSSGEEEEEEDPKIIESQQKDTSQSFSIDLIQKGAVAAAPKTSSSSSAYYQIFEPPPPALLFVAAPPSSSTKSLKNSNFKEGKGKNEDVISEDDNISTNRIMSVKVTSFRKVRSFISSFLSSSSSRRVHVEPATTTQQQPLQPPSPSLDVASTTTTLTQEDSGDNSFFSAASPSNNVTPDTEKMPSSPPLTGPLTPNNNTTTIEEAIEEETPSPGSPTSPPPELALFVAPQERPENETIIASVDSSVYQSSLQPRWYERRRSPELSPLFGLVSQAEDHVLLHHLLSEHFLKWLSPEDRFAAASSVSGVNISPEVFDEVTHVEEEEEVQAVNNDIISSGSTPQRDAVPSSGGSVSSISSGMESEPDTPRSCVHVALGGQGSDMVMFSNGTNQEHINQFGIARTRRIHAMG